jgi:hypothetical protein
MLLFRHPGALVLIAIGAASASAADRVRGTVFDDRYGDGVMHADDPGVAGVGVSNGVEVAVTGASGAYELPARAGATVFVIKPPGWRLPVDAQNLPRYYDVADAAKRGAVLFALTRAQEPENFKALLFTDVQPTTPKEVEYFDQSLVEGLVRHREYAFGVTLGDVTSDRPDLYPAVNAAIARLGTPWFNLNGNHDLTLDGRDDRGSVANWEAVYGPSTYAFRWGKILFVALNDVRYLGGPRYLGGLRPDQLEFLQNLLRVTPADVPAVIMLHIPLFSPDPMNAETFRAADRARLFALLQDRPALVLSGHTHDQRNVFYGPADGWHGAAPLHEYNVAAACGSFWGGPPDARGIPVSTMADGAPHGYGVLTCRGTDLKLDYVPAGHRPDYQIGLHVPAVVAPRQGYVSFYANVFNGHDGWTVEARIDDRQWTGMKRVLAWDPTYAAQYLAQDSAPVPPAGHRLPDPAICYHLWRAYLPADLPEGGHQLTVRAVDTYGQTFMSEADFGVRTSALGTTRPTSE